MRKSRLPLFACLLVLLVTNCPASSAQSAPPPPTQGQRGLKLKRSTPPPSQQAPPAVEKPMRSGAMRLVVQLGLANMEFGFAAFSSDSRLVATGSAGGDVVLWDVATGREVRRLSGNVGAPGAQDIDGLLWGAFSPDKRLFATAVGPNLRLWNIMSGKLVWERSNDDNATYDAAGDAPPVLFSPDGKQIIVRGSTDKLTWDTATGRLLARTRFKKPRDSYTWYVLHTAFTTGRLSAKAVNGEVLLADKATRKELRRIRFTEVEGEDKSSDGLTAIALSPDDRVLLTANSVGEDGHTIRLWDAQTGAPLRELTGTRSKGEQFHFDAAGGLLSVTYDGGTVRAKEMSSGRQISWDAGGGHELDGLDVSSDGRYVATTAGRVGAVWNAQTGAQIVRVEGGASEKDFKWDFVGFTPEETVTFYKDGVQGVDMDRIVLSTKDWSERRMSNGTQTMPYASDRENIRHGYAMTPDTRGAAWETDPFEGEKEGTKWLTVWSADPKVKNKRFQIDADEAYDDPSYIAISPDGRKALVATSNAGGNFAQTNIKVWDADQKRSLFKLATPGFRAYSLAWSPDGRTLATGADDGTTVLWDASNGRLLRRLAGQRDLVNEVEFSPDSRFLLTTCADGFKRVYDVTSGAELCRFVTFEDGSWVVVAPDGRFDTSNLDEIQGVHWLAPEDPLKPLPLEIFMRDYYEPRLLARVLAGEKFAPVRALAEVNRAQPVVNITSVEQQKERPEFARVTVEVSKPAGTSKSSGVYDLRLFRGGQLVAYAPTEGDELQLDPATGKATFIFDNVRLPRPRAGSESDARHVEFSAYAFNEDRVKSPTARATLDLKESLPATKGRAYIVSVGVNAYENEDWDLRFAANDARRLQEVVAARVREGGEYEEVVSVPLISDYASEGGHKTKPRVVKETAATKQNFKAVLDLLAGRKVDEEVLKGIPNGSQLKRATPEDLVIVSFSSHGYADERGRFYLFASDAGKTGELHEALPRAISSDELGAWLRDVDAGEMIMVVDACHSAASVQGEGFKPGPMGSRGLGQLSYDKGMRILTSTQADDLALESGLIEQGLLTYALTRDGLEAARADFKPKDSRITVAEWLAYGVERVPTLYIEVERKIAEMKAAAAAAKLDGDEQARVIVFDEGARNLKVKVSGQTTRTQQPALFDFARRRRDALLSKTR